MGSHLPVMSGREVVRVFGKVGWAVARQASSHIILIEPGEVVTLSVPDHRERSRAAPSGA